MNREKYFIVPDWWASGVAAGIAFLVYLFSTAPNVTLLDSGEFIVAAQQFGVPHPTGYPLWTLLAWAFQLIPLGNAAWMVNLFSGVCGALAVGVCSLLLSSSGHWILGAVPGLYSAAVAVALTFALSLSMWSQAVIAEVYTLHALLIGLFLLSLYGWIRNPRSEGGIYWTFFTLTLAFSNHHLTLALVPLPFLVALMIRRDLFADLVAASGVCLVLAYLAFAAIAENPLVVKAAVRLLWLSGPALLIFLIIRRRRVHYRLMLFLPFVIVFGMLPYAYLPIASATNPPMNWSYPRTVEGFFASFNRSQYEGSLSDQSLRVLSGLLGMGTEGPPLEAQEEGVSGPSRATLAWRWIWFFSRELIGSFSPLAILLLILAAGMCWRQHGTKRLWIVVLFAGFLLAAFLQPVLDGAKTDQAGWWLQMPYHTHTNLMFALAMGVGGLFALSAAQRWARWSFLVVFAGVVALPAWPFWRNAEMASQRERWFGWDYGYEMLRDLPEGAVVFGGTDPGRFIPTYMIFGESRQPARFKREPDFDRSDLYIMTQNATADPLYLASLRDQYGRARPRATGIFERWLGRETMYPAKRLWFPSRSQVIERIQQRSAEADQEGVDAVSRGQRIERTHGEIARWIWEENRQEHTFFVEESYPLTWANEFAIPRGMLYELSPVPLPELPESAVIDDMAFWKTRTAQLLEDPRFPGDFDARRAFSTLRQAGARIYAWRGMDREAETAYRESLELWPSNLAALRGAAFVFWRNGDVDTPAALARVALLEDPRNSDAAALFLVMERRKALQPAILEALGKWRADPFQVEPFQEAIGALASVGDLPEIERLLTQVPDDVATTDVYRGFAIDLMVELGRLNEARDIAMARAQADSFSAERWLDVARVESYRGESDAALTAIRQAAEIDPSHVRKELREDPQLQWALPMWETRPLR